MVRKSIKRSRVLVQGREKNVLGVVPGHRYTVDTDGVRAHRLTVVLDTVPRHRDTESQDILHVEDQGQDHQTNPGEEEEEGEGEADVLKQGEMYLLQDLIMKTTDRGKG